MKSGFLVMKPAFLPLLIAFMVCLTLVREIYFFPLPDLIPNPDSAWLIYAAGRWLDGQKLYIDIMETNPPLIIWLSAIPVWLSRFFGNSPFLIFSVAAVLVTMLNLLSLYLISKTIKTQKILGEKFNFTALLLYIAFGFFLFTPAIYGQREALFVALVLPYLLWSLSLRGGEADVAIHNKIEKENWIASPSVRNDKWIKFFIILLATIGFAIKPFFMLIWAANELFAALHKRKISSLFAWHNWLIGAGQIAYFAGIYFLTPEYINDILPALFTTYFTFNSAWQSILKPVGMVGFITLATCWLAKIRGEHLQVTLRVLTWFFACAGLMLVQRKDWLNHFYPMLFMAGLVMVCAMFYLRGEWKILRLDIGHRKFISLCLAVSILMGSAYVVAVFSHNMFVKPAKLSQKLLVEIEAKANGKYVYPLSYSIEPSFPAIAISNSIFQGGFHQLWPLMGLIIREQQGDNSPSFLQVKSWFYNNLVRDFTNFPPELVWVDLNVNLEKAAGYVIERGNRDIINVLSRDGRFAKLWQNYEKYGEIESEQYDDEIAAGKEKNDVRKPERYALYRLKK